MSKNPETIALHGGDYRSDPATTAVAAAAIGGLATAGAIGGQMVAGDFVKNNLYGIGTSIAEASGRAVGGTIGALAGATALSSGGPRARSASICASRRPTSGNGNDIQAVRQEFIHAHNQASTAQSEVIHLLVNMQNQLAMQQKFHGDRTTECP